MPKFYDSLFKCFFSYTKQRGHARRITAGDADGTRPRLALIKPARGDTGRDLSRDALIQTSLADSPLMPLGDAEDTATSRREDDRQNHNEDGWQDLEEVLYHVAVAESLQYRRLPPLIDHHGFHGFMLDDDDDDPEVMRLIAMELGESSSVPPPPPPPPEAYCTICMEDKFSFECVAMKGCSHSYCACCVSQYVAAKVEANEAWVGCPDPKCRVGFLEPEMCRLILPEEVFDRWGRRLCEEGIRGPAKFYCPYKDCSALLIDDGGDDVIDSVCPHCKRLFCAQCKVPWHSGYTCKNYQTLFPDEKSRVLMELAKKNKWQRCPRCGFFVERIEGCNYIKCRCRKTFCYKCAGPVAEHTHACPKCKLYG